MTRRMMPIAAALLALTASGLRSQEAAKTPEASKTQEPPATFPAQVEQVTVDVVVTDKKGNPIGGLTKEQLQVAEDGAPQTIVSFEAIEVAPKASEKPAPRPRVSTNTAKEEQRGRTFVVVFDDIHLTPYMAQRATA